MELRCLSKLRDWWWKPVLAIWLTALAVPSLDAAEGLTWYAKSERVDADIRDWELPKLLEKVAVATGWQIYLEPGTKHTVSTKFSNLPPGEALRLLLGNLSFGLLPQTNSSPKLFVFRTSLQEATELISPPEKGKIASSAKPIPNELIVTLKPGTKIEELAKRLGAKVLSSAEGLNTHRLQFEDADATDAARLALKENSDVDSVDSNFTVPPPFQPEALTFGSAPAFNLRPKAVPDANRVIVGLIDTPIQATGSQMEDFVLNSLSVAGKANLPDNTPTHGTSMLETLLRGMSMINEEGGVSAVRILPVDVYGNGSSTTTFDVAKGIYAAINAGAMIINLSLGSEGDSQFLHKMIQSGHEQGVLFFAAAGNEPVTTPTYPAAYPEVVAVTAGDKKGNVASYANHGDFVDVIAPGSSIVAFKNRVFLVMGTSASTAYSSGMAAGLADATKKPLSQVESTIRGTLGVKP